MKYFLTTVLSILSLAVFAQDTTYYYNSDFGATDNPDNAKYKREVFEKSSKKTKVVTWHQVDGEWTKYKSKTFKQTDNNTLRIRRQGEGLFKEKLIRTFTPKGNGTFTFRDTKNERVLMEGSASSLVPLHLEDTVKSYYENGNLKSIAQYKDNRLVSNRNWLESGQEYFEDIHYYVDRIPEHSLGQLNFKAHILNGIKESEIDLSQVRDYVVVGFVVLEDGTATGFHSVSGVYQRLNKVLINAISQMPGEWIPAKMNGKPVRYYMTLPFNFIDQRENFDQLEMSSGFVVWD